MRRHCFPVYWNGENRRVLRGHWFARKGGLDWIPLREDVSEQLEGAYTRQVRKICHAFTLATLSHKYALSFFFRNIIRYKTNLWINTLLALLL